MLQTDLNPITRKWAIALIILNLLRIGTPFVVYFQAKYQLVSPLIPKEVILDIIAPYMLIGLAGVVLTIAAFAFFVYSRFTFVIITCVINLAFVQLYFYLYH